MQYTKAKDGGGGGRDSINPMVIIMYFRKLYAKLKSVSTATINSTAIGSRFEF